MKYTCLVNCMCFSIFIFFLKVLNKCLPSSFSIEPTTYQAGETRHKLCGILSAPVVEMKRTLCQART